MNATITKKCPIRKQPGIDTIKFLEKGETGVVIDTYAEYRRVQITGKSKLANDKIDYIINTSNVDSSGVKEKLKKVIDPEGFPTKIIAEDRSYKLKYLEIEEGAEMKLGDEIVNWYKLKMKDKTEGWVHISSLEIA